ncbi:MAG: hypothetical protein PHW24_02660 [Candidatus Moranbacteria bacterium]|nr:hypothetical protein [Candidatus Moranbacteria bacterium]
MKKFRTLAVVALALLTLGSFGSVAFAKENGDRHNDRNRRETRSDRRNDNRTDNENNADDTGTVTDDGGMTTTETGV